MKHTKRFVGPCLGGTASNTRRPAKIKGQESFNVKGQESFNAKRQ